MWLSFTERFRGYNFKSFQKDSISGFIVGIVAIPLAMAFAIASGVKPEYGIYTSIIAGVLISLFGGSRFQIGGPTGAFVPVLLAVVIHYGYENLLIAGFLAGILLFLMGVFKLGSLIQFIPRPVTIGFTAGIAVIIFSGQIANFLGLRNLEKSDSFFGSIEQICMHLNTINGYSVLTAVICLAFLLFTPKVFPKVPGSLPGLLISSIAAALFFPNQVATIGSAFGDISSTLPSLHLPHLTIGKVEQLLGSAFVIAALGSIESLLSAVVADGMTHTKHDSNRELIGQGIANIITPLFGGIPATGAVARTATGIRNGATSPVSGIIHGVVVLLTLLLLAPYASRIPLASMAPILMLVAWNMSERNEFMHLLKTKSSDSIVLIMTFLLTVFVDLTTGVGIGLLLALILFTKRMGEVHSIVKVLPDPLNKNEKVAPHMVSESHDCPQFSIFSVEGPIFFAAAERFEHFIINALKEQPKIVLLRMGKVPIIDMTGESRLSKIVNFFQSQGGIILISGMRSQPREVIQRTALYDRIGHDHFFERTGDAINFALTLLDHKKCLGCKHYAFQECKELAGSPFIPGKAFEHA